MGQHLRPIKESILMCVCVFKLCLPLTYKKEHREDNFPKDVGVSTILMQADLSEFEPNLVLHRAFQASQCSKPNQNNNNTSKKACPCLAGEVDQWLRAYAALTEDQSLVPGTYVRRLTTTYNSNPLLVSMGVALMCACARSFAVLRLCVHVCTYIIKK